MCRVQQVIIGSSLLNTTLTSEVHIIRAMSLERMAFSSTTMWNLQLYSHFDLSAVAFVAVVLSMEDCMVT